jgi:adenylate cyclase
MVEQATKSVRIDLNQFKLQLYLKPEVELTLHFDTPSRRFYLSVIALVAHEMKKQGRITSIPLQEHWEVLALLNQTVGGAAGSSDKMHLLPRIYRKWKDALPDLENGPLFKVIGRKKRYDELMDRVYGFSEGEKDSWANLFEYKGSHDNVRLRFSIDRLEASLDDVVVVYGEYPELVNEDAWKGFITRLKEEPEDKLQPEHTLGERKAPESLPFRLRRWLRTMPNRRHWAALYALIGIVVAAVVFGVWKYHLSAPQVEVASVEKMAFPLPDKPSIAVLPFRNLSHDPKQEYFSDGLTEEIITGLSKVPYLFVIAHQSTFTYKGKPVRIKQVSEELGVRYVLEGSVRKAENRVRITAQLIDGIKGHHLWAEQYDRELKDIFAIQDEITMKILTALQVQLTEGVNARVLEKYTDNLQAYLKILESFGYLNEWKINEGIRSIEEARTLDPDSAMVYGLEAWARVHNLFSPRSTRAQSLDKAFEFAKTCDAMNDQLFSCKMILGFIYLLKNEHKRAISEGKRAVELNPNSANAATFLGWTLRCAGKYEEALRELERALRLNPKNPTFALIHLGGTYLVMGRNEEAIAACEKAVGLFPDVLTPYIFLAVAYSSEGRMDEARSAAAKIMKLQPNFSMKHYETIIPYKNKADSDLIINGLLKAGMK